MTGGTGAPADPYVISCWSIPIATTPGGQGGTAIGIGPFALDQAFVIRDVVITGTGAPRGGNSSIWHGITLTGPAKLGHANATIDHSTVQGFDYGIQAVSLDAVQVTSNQVLGNVANGIQVSASTSVTIANNEGSGNRSSCINAIGAGSSAAQVDNNTCHGNPGDGFILGAETVASGNVAVGNAFGFLLNNGATAQNNTIQGNNYGVVLGAGAAAVVTGNTIGGLGAGQPNTVDGVDFTSGAGSVIADNDIEGNGTAGIQAAPENTNAGFWGYASTISNNRIGHSPYGILISAGISTGNVISGTTWTDGQQAIADFANQNTVVDAGSNKVGQAGQAVSFYDYIARVTAESAPPPPGGLVATSVPTRIVAETGLSWTFGDGSPVMTFTDPTQGYGPRAATTPQVSHVYSAAGTYTATLTVTGVDQNNQPVTLSATVPVAIS